MKVFVAGMPGAGRTTVAKALCQMDNYQYIDASSWVRSSFREQRTGEHPQQYYDDYHTWFTLRLKFHPKMIADNICESMGAYDVSKPNRFVIDGLTSPRDFAQLFDYNKDVIIFLNRTNNNTEFKDYENIGVSVMRDYCFWLASASLLNRSRWIECNYQIPGEQSDFVKTLGAQNTIFIVKSIDRAISQLTESLKAL